MGSIDIYPPSAPSGMTLAYAEVTTGQTGISAETDLTSLTVTVTVPSGRRIRVIGRIAANGTVASSTAAMNIKEGATVLQNIQIQNSTTAGNGTTFEGAAVLTPSAGTHTYKLSLQLSAGTGTVGMAAAATFPAFILVEDITGTIYPAGTLVTAGIIASEQWIDFVPTLVQGVTVTKTVNYARYIKLGRTVIAEIELLCTGAGTTTVGIQAGLPVAAVRSSNHYVVGTFWTYNGQLYTGAARAFSTTAVDGLADRSGGSPVGQDGAFALANGNFVSYSVQYEAAS